MVKNTLNVGSISEGFVLDHIEAGRSMEIDILYLHLDKLVLLRCDHQKRKEQ